MYIKHEIGKVGENLSCKYLEANNYKILEKNYRCRQGEVDIIAYDKLKNETVFIEVKTRTNLRYGSPAEAVGTKKQNHIINVSKFYIYKNKINNAKIRFDVIEVLINNSKYEINHIQKAFCL